MRRFFAALALAGALIPPTAASTAESVTCLAQMPRDVTDAVRKQRDQQRERPGAGDRATREGKR